MALYYLVNGKNYFNEGINRSIILNLQFTFILMQRKMPVKH